MSKYPKYKNSGIVWLGDVPESWLIVKLTEVCGFVRGNSSFKKDELLSNGKYVALQYGKTYKVSEVNERYEFYVNDEFYKVSQIVNYGDVIFISTSETIEDLGHSVFYNRSDLGLLGGEQILLKPNNDIVNEKYLYYSSKVFAKELKKYGTGVKVFRFKIYDLKTIYTSIPTIQEQTAIANFLDYKLEKIDRFITKKKQLIELLNEQKAAIINQAVTKGLNPNAKMKPSGIEWLGDIPDGYIVSRFKNICKVRQGLQIAQSERLNTKNKNCFEYLTIKSLNNPLNPKEYIFNPNKNVICYKDDILVSRTGSTGEIVINVEGVFHNNFFLVNYNREKVLKMFLYYYLTSSRIKEHLLLVAGTTTVSDLNHSAFYDTPFIEMKKDEQTKIVHYIETETTKIEKTINTIEKEITLVEEYKTALIAEAVTGKIDIRNFEIPQQETPLAMVVEEVANYNKEN